MIFLLSAHTGSITRKEVMPMCHRQPASKQDDPFFSIESTQSANECTGLMPAAPENADEAEALSSIMAIHCPPSATWKDQASAQSPDVHAHPSGAHSPQRNTPAFHPAKGTDRNHPAQGHNP